MKTSPSLTFTRLAARLADDKLGQDIVAMDVRAQTVIADYFLFVGATSHLHVRSLEDAIREGLKEAGATLLRTDGQRGHLWRVLDYGGLMVHIMDQKTREFYGVERLWDQAKKISFSAAPTQKKSQRKKLPSRKSPSSRKRK